MGDKCCALDKYSPQPRRNSQCYVEASVTKYILPNPYVADLYKLHPRSGGKKKSNPPQTSKYRTRTPERQPLSRPSSNPPG
ncbi:hypothetical protein VTJ04DRAFT_5973 [Mycothermus thermophilus]|uniref:uncharacterized protein n=1 Tax=Humicola insolens TaxID=85995 RepID=UPI0037428BDE